MFVTSAFAQSGEAAPAEGETHTATEAAGGHEAVFPPFNSSTFPSQLLWLAITFGLFYLFVKTSIVPRIAGILETRRAHIASDLDQAARIKADADAAIAAYEQEVIDARNRAVEVANKARDEARAEADAQRRKVEAGLEEKLAESERHIASIKASAMKDVGAVAEDTAALIVERLLGGGASVLLALGGIGLAATSFVFLFVSESTTLFGFHEYGYRPAIVIALALEAAAVVLLGLYLAVRLRRA